MTNSSAAGDQTTPSPLRVLVVDDNESMTLTFSWMLEMLGHNVRAAHDGPSAITVARAFLPQMIMLDISLPDMDGYELCRKLRTEPGLEKSIFVAQTGWSQPEHMERSRQAGFDHHLIKPVTPDQLKHLIASFNMTTAA